MNYKYTRQEVLEWLNEQKLIDTKPIKEVLLAKKDKPEKETIPVESKEECEHQFDPYTGLCDYCGKPKQSNINKIIEEVNFANYQKGHRDVDIEIMIENKLNEIIKYLMENK